MRAPNKTNVVMVVDDDLFVRRVIASGLEKLADVVELGDGDEVLKTYKLRWPDIVFLDIHLPHASGVDLLKEILHYDPDAHVVMVSADSSVDNVLKTQVMGVKGFLTKPFAKDRIINHLRNCPTFKMPE